jgi:hypothetical protein
MQFEFFSFLDRFEAVLRFSVDFATLIWPTLRFSFGPPWKTKTA